MEVDGSAEAVPIAIAGGGLLEPLDHGVGAFETCVGDASLDGVQHAVEICPPPPSRIRGASETTSRPRPGAETPVPRRGAPGPASPPSASHRAPGPNSDPGAGPPPTCSTRPASRPPRPRTTPWNGNQHPTKARRSCAPRVSSSAPEAPPPSGSSGTGTSPDDANYGDERRQASYPRRKTDS